VLQLPAAARPHEAKVEPAQEIHELPRG
jgi:hypothetical protein